MANLFSSASAGNGEYESIREVTPSDSADLPFVARLIYVGTSGDGTLRVHNNEGNVVNFVGVTDGKLLPGYFRRVLSTGTGASDIVAFY